jgi:antitoxin HicB
VAESYSFSVVLEPQEDGGFTVLVPALPEVITEGDTEIEASQCGKTRAPRFAT